VAVISFASAKGGVGKTTAAVNVAAEFAMSDLTVALIDCDVNQHATQFCEVFLAKTPEARLTCISGVTRASVVNKIDAAQKAADVVVVDLPAGTTDLSMRSIQMSQLVIIPARKTVVDIRDATRTAALVADAERLSRQEIRSVLLWSMVSSRIETRTERRVKEEFISMVTDPERAVLPAAMMEFDAYPAGFYWGWIPRQFAAKAGHEVTIYGAGGVGQKTIIPTSTAKAAANISAIASSILGRLQMLNAGQDPGKLMLRKEILDLVTTYPEAMEA
jgi:chromosome partitioning protein